MPNRSSLFTRALFLVGLTAVTQLALAQATMTHLVRGHSAQQGPRKSQARGFVEGEVMVHYTSSFAPLSKATVPMMLSATELHEVPHIGWHRLQLPSGMTTAQAIKQLASTPGVDKVEPNYVRKMTQFVPTDPDYVDQYGPRLIGCEQAWNLTLGSSNVTIAFIDTGIDLTNPEFTGRIKLVSGQNFIHPSQNPVDDNDHGTHVAGIGTAALDNSVGIAGICPTATIFPIKALDSAGNGTISGLAEAYEFAADNGADIVNASLGGSDFSQTELDAVNYVLAKGVLFVAAAGNTGDTDNSLFYPAAYPGVIGVGAVDSTSTYASWSQYGSWVKVAAPGVHIFSTYPNGQYAYDDGTSMASPHVAGALGLLKAYATTGTTNQQIENALFAGCVNIGNYVQYGLVNVNNSLSLLSGSNQTTAVAPFAATAYGGSIASGDYSALGAIDGNDLILSAKTQTDGTQLAGFKTTYLLTQGTANISGFGLTMAYSGSASSSGTVYMYNFLKGRYDKVGTFNATTVQATTTFSPTTFKPYIRAGEVRVIVQASAASGPPFSFDIDEATISVTTSGGP